MYKSKKDNIASINLEFLYYVYGIKDTKIYNKL